MPLGPRRAATEACACRIPAVTSRIAGSTERASNPRFTQACGCPSPRSLDHVQKVADDLGRICNICSFPSVNRLEGHGTGPRRSQQAEVIRPLAVASVGPVCDDDQGGAEGDDDELSHATGRRSCFWDVSDDAHTAMLRASFRPNTCPSVSWGVRTATGPTELRIETGTCRVADRTGESQSLRPPSSEADT